MKYTSQADHALIKEKGFDKEKIREQLNEAEKLQLSTYKNHDSVNKTPIVITTVINNYTPDERCSYGFYFDSVPDLGKETYHAEYPAHTSYIVAILWPVTSDKEN